MFFRSVLVLSLLLLPSLVSAQDDEYLLQLIQQSRSLHLAENVEWLNLLHFKPYAFWPSMRSLADEPTFFNAADGKTNASAELEATLKVFFSNLEETNSQQNPQCRFIARYSWLNRHLKFDPNRLKSQTCNRFQKWLLAMNPSELTLLFPSSFLNSPASMYGHTLLRIDAKDQDENTRLLAYTIGYSAKTSETNGVVYAYRGLTGGYSGMFQSDPYYIKVSEYTEMENRDIWEYRLNFTPQEINLLLMHVWEMGQTNFDYYFIDENCSYNLLTLLDVARPGLQLTDEFRWMALPSDTIRAVTEKTTLLKEAVYRPSNATIIKKRLATLQPSLRKLAKELSDGSIQTGDIKLKNLSLEQQAQVLELGFDYVTYLRASKGEWPEAGALSRTLLIARSVLDVPAATPSVETPATRPDQGHRTMRVSLGEGIREGVSYEEFAFRPIYHDQLDPNPGYIRGGQIQFFNMIARHYDNEPGLRIEEFNPLDIYSLSPRDDFFQPLSWKVKFGWDRKRFADGSEPLVTRVSGGIGYDWDVLLEKSTSQTYAFMDATLEGTDQYSRIFALGLGPSFGFMMDLSSNWRMNAYVKVQRFILGEPQTTAELAIHQRYSIGRQTALRLELSRKIEFDRMWSDAKLSLQYYF